MQIKHIETIAQVLPVITISWFSVIPTYGFHVEPSFFSSSVPIWSDAAKSTSSFLNDGQLPQITLASVSSGSFGPVDLLLQYKHSLVTNPLETKMATGGLLAIGGDAIAQSREVDEKYNIRRAISFMSFDMCYRALQHFAFPIIVEQCQGQYFTSIMNTLSLSDQLQSALPVSYLAAMEQTLASQLGIVPFLYYPVFFSLTGIVQGLTAEKSLERAKENFIPLMKRNLLFWIPVQFIQFGFIEEGLQIPFLSFCGLAWTFILSLMAGSTEKYCVTGTEVDCEVEDLEGHLFPNVENIEQVSRVEAVPKIELDTSSAEKEKRPVLR